MISFIETKKGRAGPSGICQLSPAHGQTDKTNIQYMITKKSKMAGEQMN